MQARSEMQKLHNETGCINVQSSDGNYPRQGSMTRMRVKRLEPWCTEANEQSSGEEGREEERRESKEIGSEEKTGESREIGRQGRQGSREKEIPRNQHKRLSNVRNCSKELPRRNFGHNGSTIKVQAQPLTTPRRHREKSL
jgi:hypothetical protein